MAKALINAMTTEWEPTKYKDQYQTAVMEMIEAKAKQLPLSGKPQAPKAPTNMIDLVAVLQQSLSKAANRKKPEKAVKIKTPAAAKKGKASAA